MPTHQRGQDEVKVMPLCLGRVACLGSSQTWEALSMARYMEYSLVEGVRLDTQVSPGLPKSLSFFFWEMEVL